VGTLDTVEIKAFVPARDFLLSMAFYQDLGFDIPWSSDELAYLRHGDTSFLLQNFHVEALANNFMMHLLVADVDAWWRHVQDSGVAGRYGIQVGPLRDQPWGMRDFTLFDPSGVLWRIAQNL
jgi:hypothetical protein